ncbi:oxygenase MpaB family protein [Kibdelosporangium phytohabitans]|uniref:ER-bound oxygenase mpaB/mpaB'/Rubber oxygenase catalytic domain-containing protein n=1 Tax=Kibdelosporangium phytohabitans TaxID=860235 RepID=A0A0N9I0G4_9PSEU|nr:oxygenase MpaB family protein [Kibdelosporangium phytohabitans]ALG09317.1 hypothetical protein AOZ06_22550 [Kibdelosporangium phytohabitans]MBE1469423.1 hypothetical protein [Kibdelosporangium phytohabitans]
MGTEQRYARRREIEAMDVKESCSEIWLLDMAYEFPWEWQIAGSAAFYASLAPARLAELLVRTRELTENTEKRLEDTSILMWETFRHGVRGKQGKAAVRQLNRIHRNAVRHISDEHRTWEITNEDYLFVLATTFLTTIRVAADITWRPLTEQERTAAYLHFREIGEVMGLKDIPQTYAEIAEFHDDYAARHIRYTPEAEQLYMAGRGMIVDVLTMWLPERSPAWFTAVTRRIAVAALPALMPEMLRTAFGIPAPSRLLSAVVGAGMRLRGAVVRRMSPRTESAIPDRFPTEKFPDADYTMDQIGPAHTVGR